ncbi:MAG: endolytic transglycosylase MltG [Crocinitomix sp.]|nr:endolytic transglycosylase MltG [Crocinitomix sp.]
MKKIVVLAILVAIGVGGYVFGKPYYDLHFSTISMTADSEIIYVPSGSSLAELGVLLEGKAVITADKFESFANKLDFTDDKVESGKYEVTKGMKSKNLIYAFKNGNQEIKDVRITFNNCEDIYDMAGKVAPNIEADSTQLVSYIMSSETMDKYGFRPETISALFLPDTYEVGEWDMTAEEFVQRMADEYKKFWTEERKALASEINLEQSEVATLASIIEAEQSINSVEWKTIAGLYLNRLKRGIILQSDPTAKFCWGDELDGVQRLLTIHMQKDCPYNTYIYAGLPPGPIRMSTKKAMDAVLNAEDHNYIFMCAAPPEDGKYGMHNFAETNAQHNVNAAKWRRYASSQGL